MAFPRPAVLVLIAGVLAAPFAPASAGRISTGDPKGAYHTELCPLLAAPLKLAQFDYSCVASSGTRENMGHVVAAPQQLGYGHLDVFAHESWWADAATYTIVRQGDVRVCLYAATRNKQISNWGDLSARAGSLRVILPPAVSDSAATFEYLRAIDAEGLGRAKSVTYAESVEAAVREALSADDAVTLLIELPDPDSALFALVRGQGGHLVPVIDRAILRQAVGGRKMYFAQEVEVESAGWLSSARKLVTACTPLVVFTGHPDRVAGESARRDHEDLIRTLAAVKPTALLPEASFLGRALRRTKELSASGTERALELTEEARERAKPYADKAMEKAKQAAERARKAARKAYEEAVRLGKELAGQAKPEPAPKPD